jgi:hypothetical protein
MVEVVPWTTSGFVVTTPTLRFSCIRLIKAYVNTAGGQGVEPAHVRRGIGHGEIDSNSSLDSGDERLLYRLTVQLLVLGVESGPGTGGVDKVGQPGLFVWFQSLLKVASMPDAVAVLSVMTA